MIATIVSNSYYYSKSKIDYLYSLNDYDSKVFISVDNDYDVIQNITKFNMLLSNDLYIVDCNNIKSLKKEQLDAIKENKVSANIIFTSHSNNSIIEFYNNYAIEQYKQTFYSRRDDIELMTSFANDLNLNIDFEKIKYVYELTNNNLDFAISELIKLHIYYGEDVKIEYSKLDGFLKDFRTSKFFDFTNILFTSNKVRKLELINNFVSQGEEMSFISFLNSYLYTAFKVKLLSNENFDTKDISNMLKKNQYYIQNIYMNVKNIKMKEIYKLNDILLKVNEEIYKTNFSIKKALYRLI